MAAVFNPDMREIVDNQEAIRAERLRNDEREKIINRHAMTLESSRLGLNTPIDDVLLDAMPLVAEDLTREAKQILPKTATKKKLTKK